MIEKKKRMDVWSGMSLVILAVYALFLIYPLFRLLMESVTKDGNFTFEYFVKFFSNSYYGETLLHSFALSISATLVSLVLGVPLAYFYNVYEIKGRNLIQIIIILCCMSAPSIGAYAWVQLRGNNGIITQFIAKIIGFRPPSIYGFRGIVLVLALQLYPLVFMLVSGALKQTHGHDRQQVPDVEAAPGGVETDVKGDFLTVQKFGYGSGVGFLIDETAVFQFIVGIHDTIHIILTLGGRTETGPLPSISYNITPEENPANFSRFFLQISSPRQTVADTAGTKLYQWARIPCIAGGTQCEVGRGRCSRQSAVRRSVDAPESQPRDGFPRCGGRVPEPWCRR